MEILEFLETSRDILENPGSKAGKNRLQRAKELLSDNPEQALAYYVLAVCYHEKEDYFEAIKNYTLTLKKDPEFIEAAKMLLELNKDNYSVPELKYLYTLICNYQDGQQEMQQFLHKFEDAPLKSELSIPEAPKTIENPEELPGTSDNEYIRHLLQEMEKPEETEKNVKNEETLTSISLREEKLPFPGESIEGEKEAVLNESKDAVKNSSGEAFFTLDFQPPAKQAPPPQNNVKPSSVNNYGIETMTMAQLYIRQGLYEHALQILLKLQERNPEDERVKDEIERVNKLMREQTEE